MVAAKQWHEHLDTIVDSVNGYDVIECEACGFKHIVPIPGGDELELLYRNEFYSSEKPSYLKRQTEDLEWWNLTYSETFRVLESHLPAHRRRILDVGSGPGYFLLHGKQRGWDTVGIEPSAQAARFSRKLGLEITEGFFGENTVADLGRFDAVNLHMASELIANPAAMLSIIYQILDPDGLICVAVPNDYNPLQAVVREHLNYQPWWVIPPQHINYFDFESLERLLERTGFRTAHKVGSFPMEVFLLMGENYIGNEAVGRRMHAMRKSLELSLGQTPEVELLREFYTLLASRGLGRHCLIVAVR